MKTLAPAAIFALGAIAERLLLFSARARFPVDLRQPLAVATAWGSTGLLAWLVLLATLAAAGLWYLRGLRAPEPPALYETLLTSALALAVGLFWLPLLSSDVYAYAAYGEMERLGLDPHVHHPLLADPIVAAARWQWSGTLPICVYGDAFVALARVVVVATHSFGTAAILQTLRAIAGIALLGSAFFAAHIPTDARRGRRAAFFIACNPLLLYAAIEGHNDTIMAALVLGGIALARRVPFAGGALAALAAAVKAPALAAAAALAVQRCIARQNALAVSIGVAAGAAIVLFDSLTLLHGVRTDLAPAASYHPLASVQAVSPVLAAALAIAVLMRIRAFGAPGDRWCVAALAVWLAIPNPYPWYALWIVPIAAFASDARVRAATLAVAAAALLRYVPDAVAIPSGVASIALGLPALVAYAPLAWRSARA